MPRTTPFLTPADALKSLREDIQAEHTLIASRVTWYVTSQAFLLTAYATSWNHAFGWPGFFHHALPVAALVLSLVILASIWGATWAQDVYLREQEALVAKLRAAHPLQPEERLALDTYERTMVRHRSNARGEVVGPSVHRWVRVVPLLLPAGFSLLWVYALWAAPVGP